MFCNLTFNAETKCAQCITCASTMCGLSALCDTLCKFLYPVCTALRHCMCRPLPLPLPSLSLTAANSNAEPAQYKMIPFSNRKGTSNGEYDVPCQMEELEHTIGPCCYEVPCPSTLPPSFESVLGANTETNDTLQGETHYNMGCHDDGMLCNPTATVTDGSVSEHEYQEV